MNFRLLFFLLLITNKVWSQLLPVDVRNNGLANASVSMGDSLSVQINPAANALNRGTVICGIVSNPFLIQELMNQSVSASIKLKNQNSLIATIQRLGTSAYSELNVSTGIAKVLGKKMTAGIRLHYQQWKYGDAYYEDEKTIYPSAGVLIRFSKNIVFGCRVENFKSLLGRSATRQRILSSYINSGISIRIAPEITLATAVEQNINQSLTGNLGCEYQSGKIKIRCGILSSPLRQSFGIAFQLTHYRFESAIVTHPRLGPTASAGISMLL